MLAHNLGLKVVAEGVETQAQSDILKEVGCELAQGYLFSKPGDQQTISKFLTTHRTGIVPGLRAIASVS
jgi:EAL domain-containing protein (putative c-di-GMP-specific phosphodiesterase class I)